MFGELRQRLDDILRTVGGDEEAFNRLAEAERFGVYLRNGRLYPTAIGQSHTARLAAAAASRCERPFYPTAMARVR
jgi:hypothetical protein